MAAFFNPTPDERKALEDIAARYSWGPADAGRQPRATDTARSRRTSAAARRLDGALRGRRAAAEGTGRPGHLPTRRGRAPSRHRQDLDRARLSPRGNGPGFSRADGGVHDCGRTTDRFHHHQRSDVANRHAGGVSRSSSRRPQTPPARPTCLRSRPDSCSVSTRHAGLKAPAIGIHVTGQTARTVRSSSAYQQVPGPASCGPATCSANSRSFRSPRRQPGVTRRAARGICPKTGARVRALVRSSFGSSGFRF